jgi:hemerythrin superfamily protein
VNALDLLIADHNRVRGLFARFTAAQDKKDDTAMAELASKIIEELTVHTTIEEEIFYPAVHDTSEEIGEVVDEGLQEHHVAKSLIAEIEEVPVASDEWVAKMTVLIESVEHHAEEEETDMFPPLRSKLPAEELDALASKLEARKRQLGAPVAADKIDLTKQELLDLAREQEIPGRSSMSKEELAATVSPA